MLFKFLSWQCLAHERSSPGLPDCREGSLSHLGTVLSLLQLLLGLPKLGKVEGSNFFRFLNLLLVCPDLLLQFLSKIGHPVLVLSVLILLELELLDSALGLLVTLVGL